VGFRPLVFFARIKAPPHQLPAVRSRPVGQPVSQAQLRPKIKATSESQWYAAKL